MDFILLGGDLFHVNRPSSSVEHRCIKILRKHQNANDQKSTTFRRIKGRFSHCNTLQYPNFEDPNLTVSYPILTIHGNHDDPTGPQAQSVCEKLATSGLLNYFGYYGSKDLSNITIEPIILEKSSVKIALYGLGFIPDYKLKLLFDRGAVEFVKPPKDTFNVLVVHQNRVPFQKSKHIPDEIFPKYFHLIIRGHEHSSMDPEPIKDSDVDGMVYQPGSTVATSISAMEAGPKRVGLVTVTSVNKSSGDQKSLYAVNYEMINLKKYRKMIIKDISQKEMFKHIKQTYGTTRITSAVYKRYSREYVEKVCKEQLGIISSQVVEKLDTKDKDLFRLPLFRIRLEYASKKERFDELEIVNQFYPNQTANRDIIFFKKQKIVIDSEGQSNNVTFVEDDDEGDIDDDFDPINLLDERRDTIDLMIENYFLDKPSDQRLLALSLSEYTNAVRGSTEDGNVISKVLKEKKRDVTEKYKALIRSEEQALAYHDEEAVKSWFIQAFGLKESDTKSECKIEEMIVCDLDLS